MTQSQESTQVRGASASREFSGVIDKTCGDRLCKHKGTYSVRGQCVNCGDEFRLIITKGHEKPGSIVGAECPTCGCRRVAGRELL
jgi:hypothetical protein